MLTLYDYLPSGNGYKVRLMLRLLQRPYTLVLKDIVQGETRTPDYLRLNPNGRIPLLVLEDGTRLAESNAIAWYLAEGTPYLPQERLERAQALQWMCFEQYSHEPNIATVIHWTKNPQLVDDVRRVQLEPKRTQGYAALDVMEGELAQRPYFVGGRFTLADIALYAYTHMAGQGGFDLQRYPAIRDWLERVREREHFVAITEG